MLRIEEFAISLRLRDVFVILLLIKNFHSFQIYSVAKYNVVTSIRILMICANRACNNLDFLVTTQRLDYISYVIFYHSVQFLPTKLRDKYNMVLAFPFAMC